MSRRSDQVDIDFLWQFVRAYAAEFGGKLYERGMVDDHYFRIPNLFARIFVDTVEGLGFDCELYTGSLVSPDMLVLVWKE